MATRRKATAVPGGLGPVQLTDDEVQAAMEAENPAPAPWILYEVLTEMDNGHRTIHRFSATSVEAASQSIADEGHNVIGAAPAGHGLGSGDGGQTVAEGPDGNVMGDGARQKENRRAPRLGFPNGEAV